VVQEVDVIKVAENKTNSGDDIVEASGGGKDNALEIIGNASLVVLTCNRLDAKVAETVGLSDGAVGLSDDNAVGDTKTVAVVHVLEMVTQLDSEVAKSTSPMKKAIRSVNNPSRMCGIDFSLSSSQDIDVTAEAEKAQKGTLQGHGSEDPHKTVAVTNERPRVTTLPDKMYDEITVGAVGLSSSPSPK
jgi:hypothetical protein